MFLVSCLANLLLLASKFIVLWSENVAYTILTFSVLLRFVFVMQHMDNLWMLTYDEKYCIPLSTRNSTNCPIYISFFHPHNVEFYY